MRSAMLGSLIVAILSSVSCHTMRPTTLEQVGAVRPVQVWVTRVDHTVVVVSGPQIINNRLVGFVNGVYQVMPADDVQQVLIRTPATGRTVALVAAGAVGVASLAYMLSGTGDYRNPCSLSSSDECDFGREP